MFFRNTLFAVFALLSTKGALASAPPETNSIEIATTAYYACNCPNNCDYTQGHSCKFYSGPSGDSSVIDGTCQYPEGSSSLTCIGTA